MTLKLNNGTMSKFFGILLQISFTRKPSNSRLRQHMKETGAYCDGPTTGRAANCLQVVSIASVQYFFSRHILKN